MVLLRTTYTIRAKTLIVERVRLLSVREAPPFRRIDLETENGFVIEI